MKKTKKLLALFNESYLKLFDYDISCIPLGTHKRNKNQILFHQSQMHSSHFPVFSHTDRSHSNVSENIYFYSAKDKNKYSK